MMLEKDNQFNIFPSHIGLRKYIQYYNIVFPEKDTFLPQYTLMPNACGTLSLAFDGNAVKAELWGASLTPIPLGREPNRYHILLLIQFSPYGLYQMIRQSQAEFADKRLSLADIDYELCKLLHQAFVVSETTAGLVNSCEKILYQRMEKQVVSDALLFAAAYISDRHGQTQVQEVARQSGYSERHLNRLFLTQIGMNMKNYARLIRFNYVLKQIQTSPCFFAALSQQAGYFDQAHFDKDFKAISGVTPQQYLETMSDFYYDGTEVYPIISL
ncbi:AraC family transcriptional regulator [Lactonifactor longoviformis]|uniref:Transcriptional regulator, AraC family n=1 Tax=Lactonifactor longoviformis DSM 17459 TaxID=1122155 RepID=A0A1M4UN41_9CLOT|nr:helix-turn-helix transcriptional regulator [Lactonifactor longoviformis]POP30450.1 AraC family transcriptional regulator [Lactonifactor longoviformis]SHE58181.1 transcriptional regulator, AraC family [Lactonifactor longoviformis DSM 17459]